MGVILVLKLILVPALIAAVTLASRRWGPSIAGWLSAFPVVSAPILYFIALEQGAMFTATAAVGTLSAVLAILVFGLSYAWAATRYSWGISLLVGFAGYFCAVMALTLWAPTLNFAAAAVLLALLLAPKFYRRLLTENSLSTIPRANKTLGQDGRKTKPASDLIWRMSAGAILVLLVTHFSSTLGPRLSGVFAMFPVMGSVLVVFSHRLSGAVFATRMLRGMVLGYYAFSSFCFVLALALRSLSIDMAFLISLSCALVVQIITRFLQRELKIR
jgi:hypothetical protein